MRQRDGSIPPKPTYEEIMEELNNASEEFKQTPIYRRLCIKAELDREAEEKEKRERIRKKSLG